jgi:hypothetical protein
VALIFAVTTGDGGGDGMGIEPTPGRLSSAPQTVLNTAGLVSTSVHQRPLRFSRWRRESLVVRLRPLRSATLAVEMRPYSGPST